MSVAATTARKGRARSSHNSTKEIKKVNPYESQIGSLFGLAQKSVASHRKHVNALHALFEKACAEQEETQEGQLLIGEKLFADALRTNLLHILGVKKGVEPVDRIVKFVAAFVAFEVSSNEGNEEEEDEETSVGRLIPHLVNFLLSGFRAKDKNARFRCVQLVALMVNSLGEVDDDVYTSLKNALLERVHDKESSVRMQATVALSKLQAADEAESGPTGPSSSRRPGESDSEGEDEEGDELEAIRVEDVLIDIMVHDPSHEVRRAALFNLVPSPKTLPALVSRTLDTDAVNRRSVLLHVLFPLSVRVLASLRPPLCSRHGTDLLRDVLRRALRDREESVRRAGRRVLLKWIGDAGGLVAFLSLFNADEIEDSLMDTLLENVFEGAPELLDELEYTSEAFYDTARPLPLAILRHYLVYLRRTNESLFSDIEPVLTTLAAYIDRRWSELLVEMEADALTAETLAILSELVRSADLVDGDEMGRRHMFEVMRKMLLHAELPLELIAPCMDVLIKGTSEKDAIQVIVEIVQRLRDESDLVTSESEVEDEDATRPIKSSTAQKKKPRMSLRTQLMTPSRQSAHLAFKRKELDLRCLAIVQALFERVVGTLQENSMVHGLVAELIVPAVKTKDADVRTAGLISLGLCCLLDRSMAQDCFELFAQQTQSGDEELAVKTLQILFDLLVVHGFDFADERGFNHGVMNRFLANCLEQAEPVFLAVAAVGVCKLLLGGVVYDSDILQQLVLLYFAADTADNQALRQALSFFFPVYCYSNPENQRRMARVAVSALLALKDVYDDTVEKEDMVSPLQMGVQLLDWCDPAKLLERGPTDVLYILVNSFLVTLYSTSDKEARKALAHTVAKLALPDELDVFKAKRVLLLLEAIREKKLISEALPRNALKRFETAVQKDFVERVAHLSQEELQGSELIQQTVAFIQEHGASVAQTRKPSKPVSRSRVKKEESEEEEEEEEESEEEGSDDFEDL